MTRDPEHGFGLLPAEDQDKMEQILTERSEGTYGMPALHGKEGDTTPDPQTWCNGFVEGMAYQREDWAPLLTHRSRFFGGRSDPDEWEDKDVLNPFSEMTPLELCDAVKLGTLAIHTFWSNFELTPSPTRASETPGRNDPCPCGSGKKYKRCCGRQV
jgi:uncharacterized protein